MSTFRAKRYAVDSLKVFLAEEAYELTMKDIKAIYDMGSADAFFAHSIGAS